MENFTIEVSERPSIGKSSANRCRREGFIPAVAYHKAETPLAVQVPLKEFTALASKARRSQVFTFKSSVASLNGKAAIVKEVQQDYLKGRVIHVDFQTLKDDEEITVEVPVKLVGDSPGVKNQGGILAVVTHEVSVTCLPKYIPSAVAVDISSLALGQSIHAEQLVLGEGVTLADDPTETIVSVVASRAEEEAKPAAAAAEAAPAAAAPAAAAAKAPAK
ncbi:MAG: ribosomal protein [Pseudomonadota bacterium]